MEIETISTPQDKTEVINMVKEASTCLLRMDSERDLLKEIAARAKEEFEIKPADFNKVVKMYHKQNRHEEQEKHQKIDGLYEKLFDD
ncbi:transcriptional regulator [Vibrio phage 1.081.O._10N.286.52.C2]|nr:transcriptional regulator [Vibrio phage 1.081.O._10N.286.52.C2]